MARAVNEYGKCVICNYFANEICLNCNMFVCNEHIVSVPFGEPTIKSKIFCPRCKKK